MDESIQIFEDRTYSLFEKYAFPRAIHGPNILWSFSEINRAIKAFSQHVPQSGDAAINKQSLQVGYARRLQILAHYSGAVQKAPFRQIGDFLGKSVIQAYRRELDKPVDKELDYLDEDHLRDLAYDIDQDLRRAFKACQGEATRGEYKYQGRPQP
jgi:hypothetical protein